MFCKNCGSEIGKDDKFCANCGYDSVESSNDLDGVTKISTPLFILFSILTLGIYPIIKWYRITGDIRKIVPKNETVSPLIITSWLIISFLFRLVKPDFDAAYQIVNSVSQNTKIVEFINECVVVNTIAGILLSVVGIILYCHILYRILNNIQKIARIKQNKDLKYNKFWAFIFNIIYINFVINTYDQRLVENKK